jgi:hypothetical protein
MRCRLTISAKTHPHALLYHYAAHAVVMDRFDIPVVSVRIDARSALLFLRRDSGVGCDRIPLQRARIGAIHALMEHRDPGRKPHGTVRPDSRGGIGPPRRLVASAPAAIPHASSPATSSARAGLRWRL